MNHFLLLLPELLLALTIAGLIGSEIGYHGERTRLIIPVSLAGLASALIQTVITSRGVPVGLFGGVYLLDGIAVFFKIFSIAVTVILVLAARHSREIQIQHRAEYFSILTGACLAMCVASAANELFLAFLALQLVLLLSYMLAGIGKKSVLSTEAAVKQLIVGSVSLLFFLSALALVFAATHTLNLTEAHAYLIAHPWSRETELTVFILLVTALGLPAVFFPFSNVSADVLEGAPTPSSAFLAIGPRAAAIAVLLRIMLGLFIQSPDHGVTLSLLGDLDWRKILEVISSLTLLTGSILAFRQSHAKRLVAYLLVAEGGFMLMGVAVMGSAGISAALYGVIVQVFSVVGVYAVLSYAFDEIQSDRLDRLRGILGWAVPEGVFLMMFMAALVGLPPFPGFIAKFALIGSALEHGRYGLVTIAIFSGMVSTIAVARLGFNLAGDFTTVPLQLTEAEAPARRRFLIAMILPLFLLTGFAQWVFNWSHHALRLILW